MSSSLLRFALRAPTSTTAAARCYSTRTNKTFHNTASYSKDISKNELRSKLDDLARQQAQVQRLISQMLESDVAQVTKKGKIHPL
jgi:hypothetical protein